MLKRRFRYMGRNADTVRIPWGGSHASELMLKLAQMKYSSFPTKVTPSQATVRLPDLTGQSVVSANCF